MTIVFDNSSGLEKRFIADNFKSDNEKMEGIYFE